MNATPAQPLAWQERKAAFDAEDRGGVPSLDEKHPPHGVPLHWWGFKAWATVNLPEISLAVVDEQLIDPIARACLQAYRAGRIAK